VLRAAAPDGRIDALRVLPPPELAPFIHHFWWVRWTLRSPFHADVLAHPSARIVLAERDGTRHTDLAGVQTGRLAAPLAGQGQVFGITFRPAMLQPLVRASMATFTNRVVPLRRVLGSGVHAWARAVHSEPELQAKVAMASAFLLPLLGPARSRITRLRDLAERMKMDRSLLRVEDAAAGLALNVRALQRAFRRYVGVSPKWVLQRYRLLEAAEQLKGPRPPTLATLAATLGYADQAHFARDFKLTVGQTPWAFLRASELGRDPKHGS
jgi:AraC-like DNA-binding protein